MGQDLVFRSEEQRAIIAKLDRIAVNDAEVMIYGPSGVGKELYADYIHRHSRRCDSPFVAVNCANLSVDTLENELFGHAKGAFTGAAASTQGIVAAAEGGTLFLDEIDSLSLPCQSKLLRFVQLKEYRRLGEVFTRKVNLRLIAACNRDLRQLVAIGRFREDLFFRLHVLPVTISPLCKRPDDVRALFDYFSARYANEYGLPEISLTDEACSALERYDWPGNVRELENTVRYLTCLDLGRAAEPSDFPCDIAAAPTKAAAVPITADMRVATGPAAACAGTAVFENGTTGATAEAMAPAAPTLVPTANDASGAIMADMADMPLREAKSRVVESFERAYVEDALDRTSGNVARAARDCGKHRRAFFELMRRYGIDPGVFRRR